MKKSGTSRFHRAVFRVFRPLFWVIAKIKFKYRPTRSVRYKEPLLIMCNHVTDIDFMLVSMLIRDHFYFVCSQHALGIKVFGPIFKRLFSPIPVFKGGVKPTEVMDVLRRIKGGSSILIFPEGKRSHNGLTNDIAPSAAKLAKTAGCKLVTVRIEGGFLIHPRWNRGMNGGRIVSASIVGEYSADYLKNAPIEEIHAHIRDDLHVDSYEIQSEHMIRYKLKRGAEGMERYYNYCPLCRRFDTVTTDGDMLSCECGMSARFTRYGYVEGNGMPKTFPEWDSLIEARLLEMMDGGELFSDDEVELSTLGKAHERTVIATGKVIATRDGLTISDTLYPFARFEGADVLKGGSSMLFTIGGVHYELYKPDACLAKYFQAYEASKKYIKSIDTTARAEC